MIQISAIILTKNEENMIADCLDSVGFCDEIIVIDNGSTDRTVDIAKSMGAKVFQTRTNDFAENRNLGRFKAKGKWVLYIDADERISSQLQEEIKQVAQATHDRFVAYSLRRQNYYFGNHLWPYIEELERLFRRDNLQRWFGQLHETAQFSGEKGTLNGFLMHYSHRNLSEMVEKTNQWSETEANLRLSSHHPKMSWWRFPRVMITAFYGSYIRQKGYRAGTIGLLESMYQSFSIFITYAKLWEKQQNSSEGNSTYF